ncbi:MAG: hypothetical protein ABS46_19500 [Cytophagaceae bacterium SCN 52-12]|nr:MAG: hypothetical protein ABS46_19500 [Cytophagaceae bacterium SCN 52-12]
MSNNSRTGNYRWFICGLLFFATTINYIDRQIIGFLKPVLEVEFNWTETDYGRIVMVFSACYALGFLVFGNFIDRLGSKIGYAISVTIWSVAAILHAAAKSTFGFGLFRGLLGVSEAGNFPAAVKVIAEWFPQKERGVATGIFNSGTSIGPIIAPILIPWLLASFGWKEAFIITGALGFVWLAIWWIYYEIPEKQKRLSAGEFNYIHSDVKTGEAGAAEVKKIRWARLLTLKQTWVFIVGKLFTDPIWWFFLFWLPSYFASTFDLDLKKPSLHLAVVYTLTTFGSIAGGYLSSYLLKKGWPALKARKLVLLIVAILVLPILLARYATDIWVVVFIIAIVAAAHQAWSTNMLTVVSDIIPKESVSSVVGIGGMAGSLGSTFFPLLVGTLLDHYKLMGNIGAGYNILFTICGLSYFVAWVIIQLLTRRMKPVEEVLAKFP